MQWTVARWRPSDALELDDPVLAADLDRAVAVFGRYVEGEMEAAARAIQERWQRSNSGKGKAKPAPGRQEYSNAADKAWKLHVRQILVFGPWQATNAASLDMTQQSTGIYWHIEKDKSRLTGDPAVDLDAHQGERREVWTDGRVIYYGADGSVLE